MKRRNLSNVLWLMGVVGFAVAFCLSALAQPGPGEGRGARARLTQEQAEAAWKLQAQHVGSKLGLSEENVGKLVEAYVKARKDHQTALEERRSSMERGPDAREAWRKATLELAEGARENLKKAVASFLDEKQTETAVQRLGTFDARWDVMVHTIAGFNLGEKQADALELINTYVIESRALMATRSEAGPPSEDFREKAMALRTKLDENLSKILSEEQLAQWKQAVAFGTGARRGGEGRGEPRREGPGQGNAENR
ncbi:MAG TPA: hypothetical protein PKY35_07025 [Candidatus Hydrogenedentes bacterium]|nr:hypothetical protein [Candidatus Hydrogenedentota bacterium]HOL76767.1 hypothetical protein [Candidatus Hydrogenedentota bacterium]HPO85272.1 hypothetical protein [Candidatus Hydrogenedentota bacterium]